MADKKPYRVSQIEGKISWQIEELWEGGETRSPYGSKEAAIAHEEKYARENGFIDDLVLEVAEEAKTLPTDAFTKSEDGTWTCLKGCSVDIEDKEVVFTEGMQFKEGDKYLNIDIPKYLEEKLAK